MSQAAGRLFALLGLLVLFPLLGGRRRFARLQVGGALSRSHASDGYGRSRRERIAAGTRAIGVENECRKVDVGLIRQSSARAGRHGRADEVDQFARGPIAPLAEKVRPR